MSPCFFFLLFLVCRGWGLGGGRFCFLKLHLGVVLLKKGGLDEFCALPRYTKSPKSMWVITVFMSWNLINLRYSRWGWCTLCFWFPAYKFSSPPPFIVFSLSLSLPWCNWSRLHHRKHASNSCERESVQRRLGSSYTNILWPLSSNCKILHCIDYGLVSVFSKSSPPLQDFVGLLYYAI